MGIYFLVFFVLEGGYGGGNDGFLILVFNIYIVILGIVLEFIVLAKILELVVFLWG